MSEPIVAYTDGACRGNPGESSTGVWLPATKEEFGHCIGVGTNNEAEYRAVIYALDLLVKRGASSVEIRSDSMLLVKQLKGEYRVKADNLIPLHEDAARLASLISGGVTFTHVLRGKNVEADKIANKALDRLKKIE